ncbi:MAG: tetratricopeptide repeat protein [Pseudomonadota bacterium]
MRLNSVNLKRHLTALAALVLLSGTALGAPASEDQLERLKSATEDEAKRIASEIELEWSKSGSAAMDLLLRRGKDAIEAGNFTLAIGHLTALTDHAPGFAEGFHARAEAYYRADLYGPALDDLQTTLELDPTHYDAIFGLGTMFQAFGDARRAADLFRRVLVLHPNHENAIQALERLKRDGIGREL